MAGEVHEVGAPEQLDGAVGGRRRRRHDRRRARGPRRARRPLVGEVAAPGPATNAATRRRGSGAAPARRRADHALSDGLTDDRPAAQRGERGPRHAVQRAGRDDDERPVAAGDDAGSSWRGQRRRRPRRAAGRAAVSRDAADPWTRLSRCRANAQTSRCSSRSPTGPRSCSVRAPVRARRPRTGARRGWRRRSAARSPSAAMRLGDGVLGGRRLAALAAGPPRQRRGSRARRAAAGGRPRGGASGPASGSTAAALERRSSASSADIASSSRRPHERRPPHHRAHRLDAVQQLARPAVLDGQAGAELDQLGAVVGGMGPGLERAERGLRRRRRRAARR